MRLMFQSQENQMKNILGGNEKFLTQTRKKLLRFFFLKDFSEFFQKVRETICCIEL